MERYRTTQQLLEEEKNYFCDKTFEEMLETYDELRQFEITHTANNLPLMDRYMRSHYRLRRYMSESTGIQKMEFHICMALIERAYQEWKIDQKFKE